MALTAVIFDIDGTLIDTNEAHVKAWTIAFEKHGHAVSPDRIAVEIGKGGDKLIPSILGGQINRRNGKSLREAHTEEYAKIANASHLRVFDGVDALLKKLKERGLKLAIATSSSMSEWEMTCRSANAAWADLFDVMATGDDSGQSKPAPGILQAAVDKLRLSPAECLMVGDTPYDADTAREAGVVCFGVTCGQMNDAQTLRSTGMRMVYRDPADIADHLGAALRIASPASAVLTQNMMESLMREALAVARVGMNQGEVPIGCVIARGDGTIIARGHNEQNASQTKTAHAEIVTFGRTAGKIPLDAQDLILVSTLEPCVMCLGAAMEAAVDTILYATPAPQDGGTMRVRPPVSPESKMPRIVGKVLADESRGLFEEFLRRPTASLVQVKFVRDLLGSTDE